ncbi:TPA: 30S ribosomal protein S3 [archaeon]|uniref:Small ribosomal subunit protein uS3 n=1 Tax=Candidatus Naiadarchaeum limnaeum TaxID=2756139 RepID=A0A832XIA2_9ARCH|nr:30S ribosomal protein S3 [Candidatus Naiadarchaeales archaeon SRR2090153.bin1042]HIK00486.1 30S ribosomal protein S3 [Candidatus Naiadarchaeum limnaeum]
MAVERKFLQESLKKVLVDRYVREEMKKVGVGDTIVKRTPLGTRIIIEAVKPGLVIGRRGKNIQALTDAIKEKFNIENPQLEVGEIPIPEFNPGIMTKQLAQTLEAGVHFRRACYDMLQQIMRRGALGVMIIVTGKISGARARSEKFKSGYIRYCGEPALLYVKEATTQANLRQGIVGVKIKIMPPIENAIDALELRDVKYVEAGKEAEVSHEVVSEEKKEVKTEMHPKKRTKQKAGNK